MTASPSDEQPDQAEALRSPMMVYTLTAIGTIVVEYGGQGLGLSGYTHLLLALLFLVTAVWAAQRARGGLRAHGLWLGGLLEAGPPTQSLLGEVGSLARTILAALPDLLRETGVALLLASVTFPPFVLGFYAYHGPHHPFSWAPPTAFPDYMASQLLIVALPEEALFRGYLQTRFDRVLGQRVSWMGICFSPRALLLQSLLFALLHLVVDPRPARLAVFFPGLLFGLLREARGGIGAAVVYHALCNLLSDLLVRGFL